MSKFTMVGEPKLSGNRISWRAVLDPGTFEMALQGTTTDTVQCWKMTANDPSGLDAHGGLVLEAERWLPHDVMPGDGYENNVDIALHDGYYHVVLTVDDGQPCQLNVRVENGIAELQTWFVHA